MKNKEKQTKTLSDDELKNVAACSDIDSLRVSGKTIPLPQTRSKKEEDGGYVPSIEPDVEENLML